MNIPKLRAKMVEKEITGTKMAEILGISHTAFSNKMRQVSQFTQREMSTIAKTLDLSIDEISDIFFARDVY